MRITARAEQGSVLLPTLIASLVGAVLAIAASVVLVQAASESSAVPIQKPLITYDQR
ncbi:MAG TPA: hypothetical protein VEL73_06530 [Mycobacteriales bacterium]|nr:hypothetical protein [Mycobacteriales bacterium]